LIFSIDIAERLAAFERRVLGRMFGGIKVDENWREVVYSE